MRGRFQVLLVVLILGGCHPRYELRGTGGSGSFHTIQARILVLIATKDYAQAREFLELAADLTQEQHDRLEQIISAAERGLVPFLDGAVEHIFRNRAGHFAEDTAGARELIQTTVTDERYHQGRWAEFGAAIHGRIAERSTMTSLDPERAFMAANSFLWDLAKRTNNDELKVFYSMSSYVPGVGSGDPAMWGDWLAWVKKVQTGELLPDGRRDALTAEMMQPLDAEQAYAAMFEYLEEYWNRVKRPPELSDVLGPMRYTPGVGTADPSMWASWLAAFEKAATP